MKMPPNGEDLIWIKVRGWKTRFQLRAGERVLAILTWGRGSRAVGDWDRVSVTSTAKDGSSQESWCAGSVTSRRTRQTHPNSRQRHTPCGMAY
jgi:hypothetical protein